MASWLVRAVSKRVDAQLERPAAKREIGGHGDFMGFFALVEAASPDLDLSTVELPLPIKCGTCRFFGPEFNEKMPCWNCITDLSLPKWRPAEA